MMKKIVFICLMLSLPFWCCGQYSNEAKALIERAAANDGTAEWKLAMMYLEGKGVPRHYYMATHWLSQAFVHGEEERVVNFYRKIAKCDKDHRYYSYMAFMKGMIYWFMVDYPTMGARWFSRASHGGNIPEASTMYCASYGSFLKTVPGAEEEVEKLARKRRQLAEQDPFILTLEGVTLCEKGDTLGAIKLWEKCADAGMPLANNHLGKIYLLGKGKYYDADKAVRHFQEADRMKMLEDYHLYSLCHRHGLGGLAKDSVEARRIDERQSESMNIWCLLEAIDEGDLLLTAPVK